MDRLVIDSSFKSNSITLSKDSYVVIKEDVQANDFEFNIIDCKATIIDMSKVVNKILSFSNSDAVVVEIVNDSKPKLLCLNNSNSIVEYNIIDLLDTDIKYSIKDEIVSENSKININVASISYKNKNKDYKVDTFNLCRDSINEINCFGIVKDKSVLNYDVSSFIKNGAKKSVVRQNSSILLFDEESVGKNNPILLIEENDVKASHGSSIGKIDDETMFYLCSRGLSKSEATNLICLGKVEYLINKIDDKEIKESLVNKFKERMS